METAASRGKKSAAKNVNRADVIGSTWVNENFPRRMHLG